jgi:hypothetical protein
VLLKLEPGGGDWRSRVIGMHCVGVNYSSQIWCHDHVHNSQLFVLVGYVNSLGILLENLKLCMRLFPSVLSSQLL